MRILKEGKYEPGGRCRGDAKKDYRDSPYMDKRMNYQHKGLALGRWKELSFPEQMANIGSEVSRAINWQRKGKEEFSQKAAARALELLDLSLDSADSFPRRKELARVREALVDYFYGSNRFASSGILWQKYFDHFNYLARKNH